MGLAGPIAAQGRSYTRSDTPVVMAIAVPWSLSCHSAEPAAIGPAKQPPDPRPRPISTSRYNAGLTTGVGAAPVPRLGPQGPQTSPPPDPSSMHRPHSLKRQTPPRTSASNPMLVFRSRLELRFQIHLHPYPRSHRYVASSEGGGIMCRHDCFTDHCPRLQWPMFLRLSNSPDSNRWLISWALQAQSRHRGRSYTRSDTGVVSAIAGCLGAGQGGWFVGPTGPIAAGPGATAGTIP